MNLLTAIGLFVISVIVLIGGAKYFTDGAERIGLAIGMSPFAIGVTIVSIGTSLPELISAIVAVNQNSSEIVAGNIIGACLSNLLFVLGLTTIVAPQAIDLGDRYIFIDLNYLVATALIVILMMYDGRVTLGEGLFGLAAYGVYTFYLLKEGNTEKDILLDGGAENRDKSNRVKIKDVLLVIISGIFIYLGAKYTVFALERIAEIMNVSKAIVSLTLLSVGTTLPEATVSAIAARQGKGEIAIGNILGSCIFNGLAIMGIATGFGTIVVTPDLLQLPLPLYGGATLMFYLLAQDKKISRWEGLVFLIIYLLFIGKIANII
jgi:cation:H+ antiporter